MCGRRGYCRNHITRRAPLREKMVSVRDKSLRTWYFLCSIWRKAHVGSEPQKLANSPWDLRPPVTGWALQSRSGSMGPGWPQASCTWQVRPNLRPKRGRGKDPTLCSAAFQRLNTPHSPLFRETLLGREGVKQC